MCEDQIQEVVRQRYASAARAVSGSGGCCGAGGESDCCNPITSNLYADGETSGLPREAVLASLGCGNPMALAELREGSDGRAAVVFQSRRHLRLGSDDPARAPLGACVDPRLVGLYITAAHWFTASTSFANPAVAIARSLTNTFSGVRPTDLPAFITAQLVGAVLGMLLATWLLGGNNGAAELTTADP